VTTTDTLEITEARLEPEPAPDEPLAADGGARRRTVAVLCFSAGSAAVAGGIFTGLVGSRLVAALAAILGGLAAYGMRRVRSPLVSAAGVAGVIFFIGVLAALAVGGAQAVAHISSGVTGALKQVHLVRPPIDMTSGFAALVGWLMAGIGFAATWVALVVDRPVLSVLVPLPVAAITAISVPHDAQVASGLVLLVSFVVGLVVISSDRSVSGTTGTSLAFELRRAMRALPVIAIALVALVFASRSGLLFPKPVVNPSTQAQKPHAEPLSQAPDRPLFDVRSSVDGPWVMGALDVYDGHDWRLPPFEEAKLVDIPRSGVVDPTLQPGIKAAITIRGLTGAVVPTLPNTVGIVASGPKLTYDARSGNIRLVEGQIKRGFTYQLAGAGLPTTTQLAENNAPPPRSFARFTTIPAAPPSVVSLMDAAPKTSKWDEWDYLRRWVLDNVTAAGVGTPVSITPERVDRIISSTKEASPYEIVAMQAMLARWVGLPSRIGYGFGGGTRVGDHLEVHPRDGAVFPEVYFNGNGWLPVIGIPSKAKVSDASSRVQQFRKGVLPSEDIAVTVFRPVELAGASRFFARARETFLVALAIAALVALLYLVWPAVVKTIRRARRRSAARDDGPAARIAFAYGEWRDMLADFGYRFDSDTPLMLLRRFPRDEEHNQLAWLVTRAMWGDLRNDIDDDTASDAEELARSLRRRLVDAHTIAVRAVATFSRASLRTPYLIDRRTAAHATSYDGSTEDIRVAV
jgi:hypothetical protein